MDAFAPTSYLHKHPFLSFEANGFNSSSKNLHFNKGSPMSACNSSSTSFFYLEKLNFNKEEETFDLEAQRSELKQEEIVQEIEQSFTQEGCQEDNEVNLSITPKIEEHVVKELEVMKPCGVVEEFEQLLI